MTSKMITLGIENLVAEPKVLKGKKFGLIANATSVNAKLVSSVDILKPDRLFGPQQGFWGETQDNMVEWEDSRIISLYGKHRAPTPEMLKGLDALVFDVQDVGTRTYTYIWTMALCMQACAKEGKDFIVCDRPNPINGTDVEGNVSRKEFSSFVSLYPLPQRHGMTAGEIAKYVNEEYKVGCKLTVVPLKGWKRSMWFDETELPWVIPSANMPTLDTATVYPGMVIFEGTNISEGRGTTRPFEFIGAPFVDGFALTDELAKYDLQGVKFRPCKFIPTFSKFKGETCGGLHIHVTDRKKFRSVTTALALLKTIHGMYQKDFKWKEPPYEYVFDKLPIDVIFGDDSVRLAIEANKPFEKIVSKMDSEAKEFEAIRRKYLIY